MRKKKSKERKERRTPETSHTVSHRIRKKEKYAEIKKDKSPKAKGSQDN